ncbi:MAG TPA: hypothetical protein VHN80_30720 [Kineosporiaceae bacterium]|nr:hypothetical protein [Kineosporiaceae bacterium]
MAFIVLLIVMIALAALAPRYGVDSRRLTDRVGGPPDLLPDPSPPDSEPGQPRPSLRQAAVRQ